ncbi:hypothetical protein AB0C02_22115 [Micromonospora sp. NPDC048999]|uniref:hypothetical protein n=1 Tax=Micromonospora sp. NPDC048999 TaxID=3155391 RepID=UPI0033EE57C0
MTDATGDHTIPTPTEREKPNAALAATGTETGFWDSHGRPAAWPDDIDRWQPDTSEPATDQPGTQPF